MSMRKPYRFIGTEPCVFPGTLRLTLSLSLLLGLLLGSGMGAMMAWGKTRNGDIITSILVEREPGQYSYQLIDVSTRLDLLESIPVPLIRGVILRPNGRDLLVISGPAMNHVQFYFLNVATRRLLHIRQEFDLTSTTLDFADDGQTVTVWSRQEDPPDRAYVTIHIQTGSVTQSDQRPLDAALQDLPLEIGEIRSTFPSPDGTWLALSTTTGNFYTLNRATGAVYPLDGFHNAASITGIDWSPDSRFIAFSATVTTIVADHPVYISDPTGQRRSLFAEAGVNPRWSPDGRYITVQGWDNLYRRAARGFYVVPVRPDGEWVNEGRFFVRNAVDPKWSQSGRLTYVRQSGDRHSGFGVDFVMIQPENGETRHISKLSNYLFSTFGYWH